MSSNFCGEGVQVRNFQRVITTIGYSISAGQQILSS
jgi:hypothetical protein